MRQCALGVAVGVFVFCVTIAMQARVLTSQDLYLHISVGRWILAHQSVPDHGIFSGSMPTAPWVAHEWLSAVASAWLYDHFGWGGVVVAVALLMAVAVGVLAAETARTLGPLGAICASVLGCGLCIHFVVARPHMATLPLMVIWIAAHVRARHNDELPPLYLMPLMTLWANLHGAFMLGLIFTALFAGEALFESETLARARAAAIRWSIFLGACVVAAAITPHGVNGLLFPLQMTFTLGPALDQIYEWAPSSLENNSPLILWCFLLLFVALLAGFRLPIYRLLMLMVLLYMAFAHRRHTPLLGLAAPLLLQHAFAQSLSSSTRALATRWGVLARPGVDRAMILVSVFAAIITAFVGARHVIRGQDKFTPAAAIDAVLARGISGQVLNEHNYGGYLIFRGVAPLIDGRIDMYGNSFVLRYFAVDQLTSLLVQYQVGWTIFLPSNPGTAVMDNLSGWTRFYSDEMAVVHVRQSAPLK